jgi:hypothetical protein
MITLSEVTSVTIGFMFFWVGGFQGHWSHSRPISKMEQNGSEHLLSPGHSTWAWAFGMATALVSVGRSGVIPCRSEDKRLQQLLYRCVWTVCPLHGSEQHSGHEACSQAHTQVPFVLCLSLHDSPN